MSSLEAVGTSSLHSSLKVPPCPFQQNSSSSPSCPAPALCNHSQPSKQGGHRHSHSRDKYSAISAATRARADTQTPVQRTGSTQSISFCCLMWWTQSTVPDTAWGAHTLRSQQTHPQSRNFIPLFSRKEAADKTIYTSLPLHNHHLQRPSILIAH